MIQTERSMAGLLASEASCTGGDDDSGPVPELTVSMPAFNTGRYIRTAIQSALRQEDVQLELIVVDDASGVEIGDRSLGGERDDLLRLREEIYQVLT